MSIPAFLSLSVSSIADKNLVATASSASGGHGCYYNYHYHYHHRYSHYYYYYCMKKYLKPINGTTIHQCRKFSDPIAEISSYRRHYYYDVKLITCYLNKKIEQSHRASIRLQCSISLSIYLLHLFVYFCQFIDVKYIWYLNVIRILNSKHKNQNIVQFFFINKFHCYIIIIIITIIIFFVL